VCKIFSTITFIYVCRFLFFYVSGVSHLMIASSSNISGLFFLLFVFFLFLYYTTFTRENTINYDRSSTLLRTRIR